MKTVNETRRDNLEILVQKTISKSLRELAELTDTSPAHLSQIRNKLSATPNGKPKEMGDATARKLEIGMGLPRGWMDQSHLDGQSPSKMDGHSLDGHSPLKLDGHALDGQASKLDGNNQANQEAQGIIAQLIKLLTPIAERIEKTDQLLAENRELAAKLSALSAQQEALQRKAKLKKPK
jgi:hypothetical protein